MNEQQLKRRWRVWIGIQVALTPLAIFYLFILPALVASDSSPISWASVVFAAFLFTQFWMLTAELAYGSAAIMYGFSRKRLLRFLPIMRYPTAQSSPSGSQVVFFCLPSYLFTLYGFAIAYTFISRLDAHAFSGGRLTLFDALYFSTITAATVGYGDIAPSSVAARLFVMGEVFVSLVYAVFFFSILASAVRHNQTSA